MLVNGHLHINVRTIVYCGKLQRKDLYGSTLGPAYNEFGYYEHPAVMSDYIFQKRTGLIRIDV